MPRYSDISVALNELEHTPFFDKRDFETAKEMLKTIPTADVEEVKHGKWEPFEFEITKPDKRQMWHKCSVCGIADKYIEDVNGYELVAIRKYCPNCGAKMDLKEAIDESLGRIH